MDGSIVETLPRIPMASFRDAQAGSSTKMTWTLHTHLEVDRSVPTEIEVTRTTHGQHDERAVMDRIAESDRTYVMDRSYGKFKLCNRIVDVGSSYVCRIQDNSVFTVVEEKPLTDADQAACVFSDRLILPGNDNARANRIIRYVVLLSKRRSTSRRDGRTLDRPARTLMGSSAL